MFLQIAIVAVVMVLAFAGVKHSRQQGDVVRARRAARITNPEAYDGLQDHWVAMQDAQSNEDAATFNQHWNAFVRGAAC